MALHLSGKLSTVGIVIAILITAFSAPQRDFVDLEITPTTDLLASPLEVEALTLPGPVSNPRILLLATGYNSLPDQTDSTPDITSTGARTEFGVIAVSRDLLSNHLPYGSLVRIRDLGSTSTGRGAGAFQGLLDSQQLFIVEDTMHARKRRQVDIWFEEYDTAVNWGVRHVEVELVRYGRHGPELLVEPRGDFDALPLLASR